MLLRSAGAKKSLFAVSPAAASRTAKVAHTPTLTVKEQKERQSMREADAKMAETVDALVQCCLSTKGKVERIRKAIDEADFDYGKFNIHALNLYLKTVDLAYTEYNDFQNRIYMADPSKRQQYEQQFVDFEELYEFVRISLCEMLSKYEQDQQANLALAAEAQQQLQALKPSPDGGASSSGVNLSSRVPSLLLQNTPLPTFDGRYENWFKFKSMFCDIVDKCVADSPATKLHYLDKALVGKAQGAIDQQTINDNNYAGAWKILTERFENLPMVLHGHVMKLLSLKQMTKESSHELKALIDDCEKRVGSLEFHKLKMDGMSEVIVITLLTTKLDPETRKCWESTIEHGKMPTYKDTIAFLRKRSYVLERCEQMSSAPKTKAASEKPKSTVMTSKAHSVVVPKSDDSCPVCDLGHTVEKCETFKKLNIDGRYNKAKQVGLCFSCLKRGHRTANCKVNVSCTSCTKKHHSLMHPEERKTMTSNPPQTPATRKEATGSDEQPLTAAKCIVPIQPREATKQILLATAMIQVVDVCGVAHQCRALLDSGAMANFLSERVADLLCLPKSSVNIPVVGVNGMKSRVKFKVQVTAKSIANEFEFSLDYLIVPRVTSTLPAVRIDASNWPIPTELQLADRSFMEPSRIDMLIGAEVFYDLLQTGKIRMSNDLPTLQESLLGWLVAGPVVDIEPVHTVRVCQVSSVTDPDENLQELLKRFWTIEEQVAEFESTSPDDDCESHFLETHTRNADGRYVVKLPFRDNVSSLGESRKQAEKRFELLERRLVKNPEMKQMYDDFIDEYLALDHCVEVERSHKDDSEFVYYLPHHCVVKMESSSTKLRVVFDASAKSDSGLSLNDVMKVGPTVQSSLFDIILRFRSFKYTFSADVPKMYRQVLVHEQDRKFQRILFRKSESEPLREIELKTVTYGTAAAPFLATRSLNQLADDENDDFPEASRLVKKSFYIDDVLTGANSLEKAIALQRDLIALLDRGGFGLHKWCANHPKLLEGIPIAAQERQMEFEDCDINGVIKTLGLYWNPADDQFMFRVEPINETLKKPTKRQILSETAKIFDPLGLLAPTVVIPKLLMQHLWRNKQEWDEQISDESLQMWTRFRTELSEIGTEKIDRRVTSDDAVKLELHGFADASGVAYGCCVYMRSVKEDGTANMKLICGKSRVAPIKELQRNVKPEAEPAEMTIPRLELCAALLLARQMKAVCEALEMKSDQVILWSDSSIVISWLRRLKPETSVFVRNRVTKIHQLQPDGTWKHVSSKSNPADVVSRGLFPKELMNSDLWWQGPRFLRMNEDDGEAPAAEFEDGAEENKEEDCDVMAAIVQDNQPYKVIMACSNYRRLQRVFGYVARFINNCKAKNLSERCCDRRLTLTELNNGQKLMVKCVQHEVYAEEFECIAKNKPIKGKLRNLNPVLDEDMLRVGGRIRHSDLPKDQKHPFILPERNHFTEILIETMHREHLHLGLNGLLATVRAKFWPVNAKQTIHRVLRKCVTCFRMKPKMLDQYMGDLPSVRVTAAQPFSRSGVDYAGPFFLKQGRGRSPMKAYVALFVCMSTKAIHLELVTSLTTEGFLSALHRFVGRRGNVSDLYSDNGTNFTGAAKELIELKNLLKSQALEQKVNEFCQQRGTNWHFIAPRAPHQGGLWESNVKSMKNHLYKSLSESHLTYEEMNTLLIQIEAILNSRPLIPMNDDPLDYEALSPGHFLVGRELTSVAEPNYEHLKDGALSRYQLIQKRKQSFWTRWSNEYITTLQKRSKWFKEPIKLRNGLLVILQEDHTPPQSWRLGRIIDTHPGKDGIIRVVTVRTSSGIYRRATTKIAVLPIDDNVQSTTQKED
ncbi:uncharacterized protein LOC109415410 [Aedes albopictus]|uniref:Integrase catalytic domain-containing protein n=1 Tax=Aedes albopictus TaxID=7160 RepID=A0ABM1ZM77_AEDAL